MKQAIIFIGIPGSGKTYFYYRHFAETHERIAPEEMEPEETQELLQEYLEEGTDFVIDAANLTRAGREVYLKAAEAAGYQIEGYFFASDTEEAIHWNAQREESERKTAQAIQADSGILEPPSLAEGFDTLYYVRRMDEAEMSAVEWQGV